jgi:hypothetical protein
MRKLKLDIDALTVESFASSEAHDRRGTVAGHQTELATCFMTCDSCDPAACGGVCSDADQTCLAWHTCGGAQTCNLGSGCYTFGGGWTCAAPCAVTDSCTK